MNPEMQVAYGKVFNEVPATYYLNNHKNIFSENITTRGILFPTHLIKLDESEFTILSEAIKSVGENEFYLSMVKRDNKGDEDWRFSIEDFDLYQEREFPYGVLDNVLYSTKGTWGIWRTMEEYSLIGGTSNFVSTYYSLLDTSEEDQVFGFIDWFKGMYFESDTSLNFIQVVLGHIYGSEKTRAYFEKANLEYPA